LTPLKAELGCKEDAEQFKLIYFGWWKVSFAQQSSPSFYSIIWNIEPRVEL